MQLCDTYTQLWAVSCAMSLHCHCYYHRHRQPSCYIRSGKHFELLNDATSRTEMKSSQTLLSLNRRRIPRVRDDASIVLLR